MKLHPERKTVQRGNAKTKKARSHEFIGQQTAQTVIDYLNAPGRTLADEVLVLVDLIRQFEGGQLWKGDEVVEDINAVTADLKLGRAEVHGFSTLDGVTVKEQPTGDPRNAGLSLAFCVPLTCTIKACSGGSGSVRNRIAASGSSRSFRNKSSTLMSAVPQPRHRIRSSGNDGRNICAYCARKERWKVMLYKKEGSKKWWYDFTYHGRRVPKSSGVENRKEAEDIAAAARTQLAKGEVGLVARPRYTIGELVDHLRQRWEVEGKCSAQNLWLLKKAKADRSPKMAEESRFSTLKPTCFAAAKRTTRLRQRIEFSSVFVAPTTSARCRGRKSNRSARKATSAPDFLHQSRWKRFWRTSPMTGC